MIFVKVIVWGLFLGARSLKISRTSYRTNSHVSFKSHINSCETLNWTSASYLKAIAAGRG